MSGFEDDPGIDTEDVGVRGSIWTMSCAELDTTMDYLTLGANLLNRVHGQNEIKFWNELMDLLSDMHFQWNRVFDKKRERIYGSN